MLGLKAIVRQNDVWADVSTRHLHHEDRRYASDLKQKYIRMQQGRKMLRAPYEIGEKDVLSFVIESLQDLNDFLDKAHAAADAQPTVVLMETKGYSNHWVKARKEIDGENYQKNDESSGITIITLNVMVRDGEDMVAFIDAKRIIDRDLGGKPNFPDRFYRFLRHEKIILIGENILKHVKRIENSFYEKTDGILFLSLDNLVRRWRVRRAKAGRNFIFQKINMSTCSPLKTELGSLFVFFCGIIKTKCILRLTPICK